MYKSERALNAILAGSWAITEDALSTMILVAMRANERIEAVEARLGRPLDNTRTVTVRDGIATIPVSGPIFRYANLFTALCGGTTVDTLATDLTTALQDPAVQGIILYIDSPGGEVSGINEFAQMVFDARDAKPITAYVADLGTSAAYWIAAAASEIVIDATATVGSIGVIAALRDPSLEKDPPIRFVSSQSPRKRTDPTTEAGRSQVQSYIDDLAAVFVATVARNRNVSEATVLSDFGQGGVLVGQRALDVGMVDRIGSYEQTLADMAQRSSAEAPRLWRGASMDRTPEQQAPTLDTSALQAQLATLERQLAAERTARISTEASAFVAQQISAHKALPTERQALTDLYTVAAQDDLTHGLVTTAAGETTRVALLKAAQEQRAAHTLTQEQLPANQQASVLVSPQGAPSAEQADATAAAASARAYAQRANGTGRK